MCSLWHAHDLTILPRVFPLVVYAALFVFPQAAADRDTAAISDAALEAIRSAGAFPPALPPGHIDDMYMSDGGNWMNVAFGDQISRCIEEEGVEEKDIIVDILLCFPTVVELDDWTTKDMTWINSQDVY